jgi:DNA-directed RNA polymerase specialized sigma24 family protein/DNA-binding CsgD family transcriptional regulator
MQAGRVSMQLNQEGKPSIDFRRLHDQHRPKLQRLAERWCGGATDNADEAVQGAFIFAWKNQERIPAEPLAVERWLIAVLKIAVRNVLSSRHCHCLQPSCQPRRVSYGVSSDSVGTTGHLIAVAAAVTVDDDDHELDFVFNSLSFRQRQLLFGGVSADTDDWERRKRQALLRRKVRSLGGDASLPRSQVRVIDFVHVYANIRNLSPRDYVSTFRSLERKAGRWLRLRDLDEQFFRNYVTPVSKSTRKRIMAVWNAAANMGIIQSPPCHARQSAAPHPTHWSDSEIATAIRVAEKMDGFVGRTAIPKRAFWPAVLTLAADLGLPFTQLLAMTWDQLRQNEAFQQKGKPETIKYLRGLRQYEYEFVFPWSGARERFYMYYARLVRNAGLAKNGLTLRERDVLMGTAQGGTEHVLAQRLNCCVGTIRQHRRRLREKLNIQRAWSKRHLVEIARKRGVL